MTTPPVSFVAHAQAHEAHNHYPTTQAPPTSAPPSTTPSSDPANGPPPAGPGPAATVVISLAAQTAAQTVPQAPSTETPPSPSPSAGAHDTGTTPTAPHEPTEGGPISLRG